MAQYYYAVSALPGLSLDAEPPWTLQTFLEFVEAQLKPQDYTLLQRATVEPLAVRAELEESRADSDNSTPAGSTGVASTPAGSTSVASTSAGSTNEDSTREHSEPLYSCDEIAGSGAAAHWADFEYDLRNALVKLRTDDQNRQNAYLRASETVPSRIAEELAREAHAASNPLEAEQILDRGRYRFLEELEVGHFFDIDRLVVYYLKLQLVTRRAATTTETGQAVFDARYDSVLEQMNRIKNL